MALNNLIIGGPNSNGNNGNGKNGNNNGNNANGGNKGGSPVSPINISNVPNNQVPPELINYNELAKNNQFHPTQFRDAELTQMLSVLKTINHPNVLITGDAGVGKTALAKQLALDLVSKEDNLTKALLDNKTVIYELTLTNLIAGGSLVGEIEKRIKSILEFAEDEKNHAILYIDEIHQLFDSHDSTMQSVAQQLKPALANPKLHVIASTTKGESLTLKKDPAFRRRFSEVLIPELTDEQTKVVLTKLAPTISKHHQVKISDKDFDALIAKANEYAPQANSHRPDSAITLLDRTASDTHIRAIKLGQQLGQATPVLPITTDGINTSADHLINLGANDHPQQVTDLMDRLNQHVIKQDPAKEKLVNLIKRQQLHLTNPKKPASFLFAGPTGTGKTEMVKQLTQNLYGDMKPLINLNMTEYSSPASLSRIIGSSRGYVGYDSHQPLPFDALVTNPYHIILLDEFEKAAPNVQRVFMQALDEGYLDDNRGQHLDFSKSIIIATTNAGSQVYNKPTDSIGFNDENSTNEVTRKELINALNMSFPIELLNRFNDLIMFKALSKDDYKQVLKIQFNDYVNEINNGPSNLNLKPTQLDLDTEYEFINKLSDKSYNPTMNGRPAQRAVHTFIENQILNQLNNQIIDLTDISSADSDDADKDESSTDTKATTSATKSKSTKTQDD